MGYLQEVDRWLDVIFTDLADGKLSYADMKRDIRERILRSYRNGQAAGQPPAPRAALRPRAFPAGSRSAPERCGPCSKVEIKLTITMGEICTVCGKECRGGFEVYERTLADGTWEVVVDTTPDRNFNVCDACNVTICFACSLNPDSGYCNDCYLRFSKTA